MSLLDVVRRTPAPEPWAEGEKIPWNDPEFSRRMLAEHLSQAHDHASRRSETIGRHVRWIHDGVLGGQPARILDLGCGPGLYTAALATLGHECVGIDFAPAAIAHAAATAAAAGLRCQYRLGDIRATEYGGGFDLALLIFGEFNVFRMADAELILRKARHALVDGGLLLLEVHTLSAVRALGTAPPAWRSAERGLFSDRPHLRLRECFWDEERRTATERYYVIDAETAEVARYAQSIRAYTDEEYCLLLHDAGFELREAIPALDGTGATETSDFYVLLAAAC